MWYLDRQNFHLPKNLKYVLIGAGTTYLRQRTWKTGAVSDLKSLLLSTSSWSIQSKYAALKKQPVVLFSYKPYEPQQNLQ